MNTQLLLNHCFKTFIPFRQLWLYVCYDAVKFMFVLLEFCQQQQQQIKVKPSKRNCYLFVCKNENDRATKNKRKCLKVKRIFFNEKTK